MQTEIAQMICGFKLRQGKRTDTDKAWADAMETAGRILALTDAKHEAPAEGAGSWMKRLADVQIGRDVDQVYFDFPHREATFLGDLGRALIDLRARSSAPEARETKGCAQKQKPGGCQLPNVQCRYPECDK